MAAPVESSAPTSDAAPEAVAVKLADCLPPSRITQLGTIKKDVGWHGDLVSHDNEHFDPETLDEVSPPAPAHLSSLHPTDLLATGERVEQRRRILLAGARKLQLDEGMRFDRVENGRWIVIALDDDAERSVRIIDALGRTKDTRTYVAVRGDLAAFADPSTMGVSVTNLVTHATLLKDAQLCTAGGMWSWSLSSRFLWCNSNRSGSTGHDLRTGKTFEVGQSAFTSPDESYLVRVPGVGWGSNLISEDLVEWTSAGSGRTVTLTKDVPHATDQMTPLTSTVPVAFCGEGKLFAIATRKELVVYRGVDAKRLAAARAMPGGTIEFSRSGRYILDKRAGAATVYRLDP